MMEDVRQEPAPSWLDRVEVVYLRLLRALLLLAATLLIVYAAYLGITSVIKIMRSPDTVEEKHVVVDGKELSAPSNSAAIANEAVDPAEAERAEQRKYYNGFVKRYHAVYRAKFERFRRPEDKQMTAAEFGDSFIRPLDRLASIVEGDLNFETDKSDLEALLIAMQQAGDRPDTASTLNKYRAAQKVNTCSNVQRTRTEYRRGWDRYSMVCSNWYEDPVGCAVQRPVTVDYMERVCSMQFPKGTHSHTELFRSYQESFFKLLHQRQEEAHAEAAAKREKIAIGNAEGRASMAYAIYIVGAFVVLMFFFLVIAIERHQRRMATDKAK